MNNTTVINNKPTSIKEYLKEVYQNRYLIISFIKKDFKVKYVQTKIGYLWIVLLPIASLIIFTVFFDGLLELNTGDVPYPAFAFSGMILWFYFTSLVNQCGNAIINAQELIKKTYFPKIILIISKALTVSLELLVSLTLLFLLLFWLKTPINTGILFIPFAIMIIGLLGFTIGLWLGAFSIKNRDLIQIIPYATNYAIWVTPVFYPTTIIPEAYRSIFYYFNPVAVGIDLFRSLLFELPFNYYYLISLPILLLILVIGIFFFIKKEGDFADYV